MKRSALALGLALIPTTTLAAEEVPAPTADQLGQICYADGSQRRLTPKDALWLARMIHGETRGRPSQADAEAMLWSIAQRSFIWAFPKWELSELAWAYSQPISPAWRREGVKCAKYYAPGFTGTIAEECSEKRVQLREEYGRIAWDDISVVARRAVLDFAAGTLANPVPGAVGWFAPGQWRKQDASGSNAKTHKVKLAEIDGNVYFELSAKPDTRDWTTAAVTVAGPGQACSIRPQPSPPKATHEPALGSCESAYTYHKQGRVASWTTDASGAVDSLTLEATGRTHRVCDDASGMIYRGSATDRYVEDAAGQKIRFVATKVEAERTEVKITHGRLLPAMLEGNRRVVIRVKQ